MKHKTSKCHPSILFSFLLLLLSSVIASCSGDEMQMTYGSIEQYFSEDLGLTDDQQTALRNTLTIINH
ncbi:MAG: tyrosine-protein phosphatase [Bacteroidales bacterium]